MRNIILLSAQLNRLDTVIGIRWHWLHSLHIPPANPLAYLPPEWTYDEHGGEWVAHWGPPRRQLCDRTGKQDVLVHRVNHNQGHQWAHTGDKEDGHLHGKHPANLAVELAYPLLAQVFAGALEEAANAPAAPEGD